MMAITAHNNNAIPINPIICIVFGESLFEGPVDGIEASLGDERTLTSPENQTSLTSETNACF